MLHPLFKIKTVKRVVIIFALQIVLTICSQSICFLMKSVCIAVPVIENRFVAHGKITEITRSQEGMQQFIIEIERTEPFNDHPCFGKRYQHMSVVVYSEIGIPASFHKNAEVSVILRVSGDERKRTLFFMGELKNDSKDKP